MKSTFTTVQSQQQSRTFISRLRSLQYKRDISRRATRRIHLLTTGEVAPSNQQDWRTSSPSCNSGVMRSIGKNKNANFFRSTSVLWTSVIICGMILLFLFAYIVPPVLMEDSGPLTLIIVLQNMNHYIIQAFGSQYILKIIFIGAVAIHVFEAIIAYILSTRMGCTNTYIFWTFQTLLIGYPSLRLLLQRRECMNRVL